MFASPKLTKEMESDNLDDLAQVFEEYMVKPNTQKLTKNKAGEVNSAQNRIYPIYNENQKEFKNITLSHSYHMRIVDALDRIYLFYPTDGILLGSGQFGKVKAAKNYCYFGYYENEKFKMRKLEIGPEKKFDFDFKKQLEVDLTMPLVVKQQTFNSSIKEEVDLWKAKILNEFDLANIADPKSQLFIYYREILDVESKILKYKAYILSKRYPGRDLNEHLASSDKLSDDKRLLICLSAAAKVKMLHDAKIVHRDLKLKNMMYDEKSGEMNIIDFGLARKSAVSAKSLRAGTACYMAPENNQTSASDVYSLAVLMIQVLTNLSYEKFMEKLGKLHGKGLTPFLIARHNQKKDLFLRIFNEEYHNTSFKKRIIYMLTEMLGFDQHKRPKIHEVHQFFQNIATLSKHASNQKISISHSKDTQTEDVNKNEINSNKMK